MTPSPPNDGLPLAISEQDGATLWPREHYSSADDAIAQSYLYVDPFDWCWIGEERVRLAWAGPHSETTEPGWWEWVYAPRPGLIECWEVTTR